MSTRSVLRYDDDSKSGPPILADDPAAEREKLIITANQVFAAAGTAEGYGNECWRAGDGEAEAPQERHSGFVSGASSCVARGRTMRQWGTNRATLQS
jgi:hypothetical protein